LTDEGEMTIAEFARKSGVPVSTMAARLKSGMKVSVAKAKPVENRAPKHVVFGETLSTADIVFRYGVARQVFNYRLRVKGMTAEQAVLHGRNTLHNQGVAA
jgi:translation initiation factor 2B subunit (eIF-2B alpha/beta/delta family)